VSTPDWREKSGLAAVYGSVTAFAVAAIAFLLLELSFKTWVIGRFFVGRASIFVDAFILVCAGSVLTLILSLCGRGKRRIVGAAVSSMTIIFVICLFGANR
jgi:hypothetical protein